MAVVVWPCFWCAVNCRPQCQVEMDQVNHYKQLSLKAGLLSRSAWFSQGQIGFHIGQSGSIGIGMRRSQALLLHLSVIPSKMWDHAAGWQVC